MRRLQHASRLLLGTTRLAATSAVILLLVGSAQALDIEWIAVGAPGNAADDTGYGAVAYTYHIGKNEVTNAQYAEFLNAVAATDTYGLYHANMGNPNPGLQGHGGITRSGSPGSYTYGAIAGRENMPVNWVSFLDAARFANWLHNGQPTGAQDSSTTEDGAYDMAWEILVVRKAGAQAFVTSEDEWYKAAYYDVLSQTFFDYPTGTDTETTCAVPGATPNTANCAVGDLTNVGSYTASGSPSGTFDQGGNLWELNETFGDGSWCGVRGGGFDAGGPAGLAASIRDDVGASVAHYSLGFRVARPGPGPAVPSLSPVGVAFLGGLLFAIAVGGLALRRAGRAPLSS